MPQQLYTYLLSPEASVVGNWLSLLLTILGFSWTIWTAQKSRQAAEQAAKAAREALESMRKLDAIQGLAYGWPRCQDQKVTKIRWNKK
jgi:type II secretory pathway pseudopilin PulG